MAKKILVVEDDQPTKNFYVDLLTQEGYDVETAQNGREGLGKILEGGYDLILLDIIMPKLDGLGVLKELQNKKPKSPNGPIIVLTVVSQERIELEASKLGATSYLVKTQVTPKNLLEKISDFIHKTKPAFLPPTSPR